MKQTFKIILIALITANFLAGQEIDCEYEDTSDFGANKKTFTCRLRINNPKGFDDFRPIEGNHDNEVNAIEKTTGMTSIVPSILCNQFKNLEILSLAEKEIEVIGSEEMKSCINLGAIYLSRNKIKEIHRDAFESLRGLRYLDLEENQLENLSSDIFRSLSKLEWLSMSSNPFHDLDSDIFKQLTTLQYLYLSDCGILELNPEWFTSTTNLQYLEMSNNKFFELPSGIFATLGQLRHLVMSNNQLKILNSDAFEPSSLKNMKSLNFNGNLIDVIDPDIFSYAENLKTARFYKNACLDVAIEVEVILKNKVVQDHENFERFFDCFSNFKVMDVKDEL